MIRRTLFLVRENRDGIAAASLFAVGRSTAVANTLPSPGMMFHHHDFAVVGVKHDVVHETGHQHQPATLFQLKGLRRARCRNQSRHSAGTVVRNKDSRIVVTDRDFQLNAALTVRGDSARSFKSALPLSSPASRRLTKVSSSLISRFP